MPGLFVAKPMFVNDAGVTGALAVGTALEYNSCGGGLGVQRAGQAAAGSTAFAGVVLSSPASANSKYVVAGVKGSNLPVLTTTLVGSCTFVKLGTTATAAGEAVAASSSSDGQVIGFVSVGATKAANGVINAQMLTL